MQSASLSRQAKAEKRSHREAEPGEMFEGRGWFSPCKMKERPGYSRLAQSAE
jgi:hypothetical protein